MGNYNCRECLNNDITSINELLINNRENPNSQNNQEIARNTRTELLKSIQMKKVNNDKDNDKDNAKMEMNNSKDQKSLLNKMKNENNINRNKYNDLIKEERDNNILLKTELNKLNNINITNSPEKILNQKDEKEPNAHNQNNGINIKNNNKNDNSFENLKRRSNSEMNLNEQQKLIELQKEQILAQQKIIEQYKKQQLLFEQQQLQLQKAKSKIKDQKNQIQSQKHESPNIRIISPPGIDNKKNVLKSNQSYTKKGNQNKNNPIQQQMKISYSKSSPKPFATNKNLLKQKLSGDDTEQIKDKHNSQDFPDHIIQQKKLPKTQIKKQEVEEKKEYQKNNQKRKKNQEYEEQIEENQIEQIENYERIEDEDEDEEEDEDVNLAYKSQKFKIETYEPIEQISKNDNIDIYDNNANSNIFNNENIYGNNNAKLEPKNSLRLNNQKLFIQKQTNKNSGKEINLKLQKKKKENGPIDSDKNNSIEFNFRGTFEEKRLNNERIFDKMNIKESGPRDSQKRKKESKHENENDNINEPQSQNVYQPQNYPLNTNELKYFNNQNIESQEDIANGIINKENFFMNNLEKTEILPINNYFQEQFGQNIYQNNIFTTPELSPEKQNDLSKFNELFDSQKSNFFNKQNDNFKNDNININNNNNSIQKNEYDANEIENENQLDRNAVSLSPYLNEVENLNLYMSTGPVIAHNDIPNKKSYNNVFLEEQLNQNKLFDINASDRDRDNPLVYSVDDGNMNYYGKAYQLQNSI